MTNTQFTWDRFWFPADSQISLIDGYLPDPDSWMGPHLDAQGVRLSTLGHVPCLILLGVPGMGKTSEMRAAAQTAAEAGELVDFISLARLSGPTELQSRLAGSSNHTAWKHTSQVWNLYLDGIDEALAQRSQIETAIPDLIRQLAGDTGQLKNLRLRISCRSAEWPQGLESELRAVWNPDEVRIYELGHLREGDVNLAVSTLFPTSAEQDEFIKYVQEYEAQPLASRPVTLNLLLNVFRHEATLPKRQVELYRKGLLAFIDEANETRRLSRQTWWLDTRSKLIVAARIAAGTIFSNSLEIWTGHQSQVPPERATILSEISGGYEPTLGSSFPVGEAELRETLLTPLFVPLQADLFGWSHQTFAEFLAAYYLLEHGLTAEEALHFFQGSGETAGQIPPQLTEVAAWLASMQPDFFRLLVRTAPDVLLRSDVAAADAEDRQALVGELLHRIDNEELHDFQDDFRSRYNRLNYPRLSEQLRPYITDKTKNRVVRRVAIDIAEATQLKNLSELLADVTLDKTDDLHIRTQAAHAIASFAEPPTKSRLKVLLQSDQTDDVDDELKGYALRSLWPTQLSVRELLDALTPPKNSNFFGSYAIFLADLDAPPLSAPDAILAVEWCQTALRNERRQITFDRAIPHLLIRTFEASHDAGVRERLTDLLTNAVRDGEYWSYGEEFKRTFSDAVRSDHNEHLRRELILSIICRASIKNDWEITSLLSGGESLLAAYDLTWLTSLLTENYSKEIKQRIINLIVHQTFGRSLEEISFVWDASDASNELSTALENAYSVEINSTSAKWQREDFERRQERASEEPEAQNKILGQIEDELSRIEQSGSSNWWRLNLLLLADRNGQVNELSSDITQSSGWALLSTNQRHRLVVAAERYLVENRFRSATWLGTDTFFRPAAAGLRAFRLLLSEDPPRYANLGARVWRKWAAAILGVPATEEGRSPEDRKSIVLRCYEMTAPQVLRVAHRLILRAKTEYDVRHLLNWFEARSDQNLNSCLWEFLDQAKPGDFRIKPILQFLVQESYPPAVELTINRFLHPDLSFAERGEFVGAAAALLQKNPKLVWPYFLNLRDRDQVVAIDILKEIVGSPSLRDHTFIRELSEEQLEGFYVWLYQHVPPPAEIKGTRWLDFDDSIEQLRNSILADVISRGTPASVAAVQALAFRLPEVAWLKWKVVDARRELAAKSWKRIDASEVIALVASYRPMLAVRSTRDAIKATIGSLRSDAETAATTSPPALPEMTSEAVAVPSSLPGKTPAIKPRRIMAVATEWNSGHGGLSTLNRELCIALAAIGHDVTCLVIDASQREVDEAKAARVRLVSCPNDPGVQWLDRLFLFHPQQLADYSPELIIGHDRTTGAAAHHIAHRQYRVPNVHFVHTLPDEIEMYKTRSEYPLFLGAEREEIQYRQCLNATLVVAVGPRIHYEMSTKISPNSNTPVAVMRPGMNKDLLKHQVDLAKLLTPHCLFLARFEDQELKGASLACRMIYNLNANWPWPPAKRPKLIMRGFDPDPKKFEKEIKAIVGIKDAVQYCSSKPYTADVGTIANDMRSASALIMPSKREGFGLTALEGIAAGIPTLVSAQSGLAALLQEDDIVAAINQSVANACVAEVDGDSKKIANDWARRMQEILSDPAKAFMQANQMRSALAPILSWERAAEQFSQDIESIL